MSQLIHYYVYYRVITWYASQKKIQLIFILHLISINPRWPPNFVDFYANAHISLTVQPTMLILVSTPRFSCMRNPFRPNSRQYFHSLWHIWLYIQSRDFFQPCFPKQLATRWTINHATYSVDFVVYSYSRFPCMTDPFRPNSSQDLHSLWCILIYTWSSNYMFPTPIP